MSVVRAVPPVMPQNDQIAVPVLESGKGYDAVTRRLHSRSRGCTVVDPLVRTPLLENGMAAEPEPRGNPGEFQWGSQKYLSQIFALGCVVTALARGVLEPYRAERLLT